MLDFLIDLRLGDLDFFILGLLDSLRLGDLDFLRLYFFDFAIFYIK
jgi:hypothetical protein